MIILTVIHTILENSQFNGLPNPVRTALTKHVSQLNKKELLLVTHGKADISYSKKVIEAFKTITETIAYKSLNTETKDNIKSLIKQMELGKVGFEPPVETTTLVRKDIDDVKADDYYDVAKDLLFTTGLSLNALIDKLELKRTGRNYESLTKAYHKVLEPLKAEFGPFDKIKGRFHVKPDKKA